MFERGFQWDHVSSSPKGLFVIPGFRAKKYEQQCRIASRQKIIVYSRWKSHFNFSNYLRMFWVSPLERRDLINWELLGIKEKSFFTDARKLRAETRKCKMNCTNCYQYCSSPVRLSVLIPTVFPWVLCQVPQLCFPSLLSSCLSVEVLPCSHSTFCRVPQLSFLFHVLPSGSSVTHVAAILAVRSYLASRFVFYSPERRKSSVTHFKLSLLPRF